MALVFSLFAIAAAGYLLIPPRPSDDVVITRDTLDLVRRLNHPDPGERVAAGEAIAKRFEGAEDHELRMALLKELELPRLEDLSPSGRLNVLVMLNLVPRWAGQEAEILSHRLAEIERREVEDGVPIGTQTRDCLDKLKRKAEGLTAPGTCGRP